MGFTQGNESDGKGTSTKGNIIGVVAAVNVEEIFTTTESKRNRYECRPINYQQDTNL